MHVHAACQRESHALSIQSTPPAPGAAEQSAEIYISNRDTKKTTPGVHTYIH